MFIYKTTNLINGKIYVGQHISNNKFYLGSGTILRNAIKKYGQVNFKREIIEICTTKELLDEREIFWISELNSTDRKIGYNIRTGGGFNGGDYDMNGYKNPMYGKKHTLEVINKLRVCNSVSYIDKFGYEKATIIKENMSNQRKGINNPSYGIKPKIIECELCGKMVDIRNYGRWHGNKCNPKQIIKRPKIGFKQSDETKNKISKSLKGRIFSDEHKEKIRKSLEINRKLITKEEFICEYCDKSICKSGYIRWHGINCKYYLKGKISEIEDIIDDLTTDNL